MVIVIWGGEMKTDVLKTKWVCFRGGKPHKAYIHNNMGASLIWCKKHGLIASYTLTKGDGSNKQMTQIEYRKFVLERVKR